MKVINERGELICHVYWDYKKSRNYLRPGDSTACFINTGKNTPCYSAVAICSLSEGAFDRNKGRKISLARALRYFPYEGDHKAFRKLVWEAYFKMRGGKF